MTNASCRDMERAGLVIHARLFSKFYAFFSYPFDGSEPLALQTYEQQGNCNIKLRHGNCWKHSKFWIHSKQIIREIKESIQTK